MKFQQGQSGNPSGRPKGSQNKRTQLIKLFEPHAEALVQKVIELALEGDMNAMRIALDRLIPRIKNEPDPVSITLPHIDATLDNPSSVVYNEILAELSGQEISLDQAKSILAILKPSHNAESNDAESTSRTLERLRDTRLRYSEY